jgi:cyanophycin synthetase
MVQLGYGARSWAFDPARSKTSSDALLPNDIGIGPPPFARPAAALEIHWEQLGPIPIVAVAGGAGRDLAARLIAVAVAEQAQQARLAVAADFDATQELLADPAAALAVLGLSSAGIAARGLAFERCAYSAITDLPADLPRELADRTELARALGVPMLLTDPIGAVALNADVPEIAALAEYAPCPIVYLSAEGENTIVGFHRAAAGAALFVRDGVVIAAKGAIEQPVLAAELPPAELPGALAALALLWTMGLTWEQIIGSINS